MEFDQLWVNGNVLTMDPGRPSATAFGILGDRFCAVGRDEELGASGAANVVDLAGRTVVPGLIETHNHLSMYAMTLSMADCRTPPNERIADIQDRIREMASSAGPGDWVRGWGYDDTLIAEKRHLTFADLDKAAPQNPVYISHVSGHLAYLNSTALEMAGIGPGTPQPEGGEIDKDEAGRPTGLLKETAQFLIAPHFPPPDATRYRSLLKQAVAHFHRYGITSVHDGGVGIRGTGRPVMRAFREMEASGELTLRVYLTVIEEFYRQLVQVGLGTGFGSAYLKLGCVKLLQDGSIQGLTGALTEPYHNSPEQRGGLIMPQETLDGLVERYHGEGLQIAVHANGDRAIDSVLLALERAQEKAHRADARHMIIHCQMASDEHIRRMKRLGAVPSYFVNHVYYWGDRHVALFLGPDRARRISPLAASLREGLIFTLHSDLPVTPVDPIFSIHCAVNRITREGKLLGPEQRIPPLEAMRAYTTHAAYCSFEEDLKGAIEPGKLADFTVLTGNPMEVEPERIKEIRVLRTVVGGRTVYTGDPK